MRLQLVATGLSIPVAILLRRSTDLTPPLRYWIKPSLAWVNVTGTASIVLFLGYRVLAFVAAVIAALTTLPVPLRFLAFLAAVVLLSLPVLRRCWPIQSWTPSPEFVSARNYPTVLAATYFVLLWGPGLGLASLTLSVPAFLNAWCLVALRGYAKGPPPRTPPDGIGPLGG